MLKWTDANGQTHLANEQIFSRSQLLAMIRPKGKWIKHITYFECSTCKHCYDYDYAEDIDPETDLSFNFCPFCGSDMRGEANG